jgi:ABC-2 type transport system permease protein
MNQIAIQELKRGGIRNWLSLVVFSMKNWFCSWIFFFPSFVINLAGMFTSAAIFYLMGQFVAKGAAAHVAEYGLSYGSYIITGVMFGMLMSATMHMYHESCLYGYWATQFDVYLQHPGGVSALLTGNVVARYLMIMLNTIIYFIVGVWLFGVSVDVSNLFDVLFILVLAVVSLTGLGLTGASTFTLLNAKNWGSNPVEWLVEFGVTLLSGVYFPPTVLPEWLQKVGEWLPQTHALRATRLCLSGKATLSHPVIVADIVFLLKFAVVTLPLGVLLFAAGMRKAQREGSLTRWS